MRVDFYILQGEANRELMACRLCNKAYQQGLSVYLNAESPAHARQIDDLLWTFSDRAFVPHRLADEPARPDSPPAAVIGWPERGPDAGEVLINLAETVPAFYERFQRVAEIVNQNDAVKQLGRRRFAYYRERRCDLHHHEL